MIEQIELTGVIRSNIKLYKGTPQETLIKKPLDEKVIKEKVHFEGHGKKTTKVMASIY